MAKIKIISNPYKKEIKFQRWDTEELEWIEVNSENNPNSSLLKGEFTSGFFPFKVKKIVDSIIDEYETEGENIEIYFEGSNDEFNEIEEVKNLDFYMDKFSLIRSDIILENARDILPEVRNLFQEMSPLIVQSVSQDKIQRDLGRFTDASSDVVPICVLGNYSAGKSTFINALIGSEILPSGTEPVTAKVYKILRSKYQDRAFIKFQYLGYDIILQFAENETKFENGMITDEFVTTLRDTVEQMSGQSISMRVNKVLSVVNGFEQETKAPKISDLIEVSIPFLNGVLAKSQHPFVIFDTPGSNSASNARHLKVLKEAMANMTNGLPIFLSTPDSLDSTDNENLYHIIRDLDELDHRFTMIVVNKADSAGIQRRGSEEIEQKRILGQAVPRNLYSGGLFYVSSILGLGSKTDGYFEDYVYEDVYDAQVPRYENPENKHYRTLYQFNIQPEQLKRKSDKLASLQEKLVYANSGLFTIETEIEAFAGKYSSYNKCFQSQMFLNRVIQITGEEIENQKQECEEIRQSIKNKLELDKQLLIEKIDSESENKRNEFVENYSNYMAEFLTSASETFSTQDLKNQEESFEEYHEETLSYSNVLGEAQKARESMANNLKNNVLVAFKDRNIDSVKNVFEDLQSDFKTSIDTYQEQKDIKHRVNKNAADSLLKYVSNMYNTKLLETYEILDSKSRGYWTDRTESLREILARIVSGSEVLTESRRKELERIIITYQKVSFKDDSAETIFDKVQFERKFKIGDQVIWESDHLNIDKLAKTYNTNITRGANARYSFIEESHKESAFAWIQSLLDEIYENIVEYSPELSKQAKQIRIMTEHIEELEERQDRLCQYTKELKSMMDWKIVEV